MGVNRAKRVGVMQWWVRRTGGFNWVQNGYMWGVEKQMEPTVGVDMLELNEVERCEIK